MSRRGDGQPVAMPVGPAFCLELWQFLVEIDGLLINNVEA